MEQQTTDPSFWLGIFSAIGAVCAVLFLLWCYARCYKSKQEETSLVEWQTFSFPEPEMIDFGAFYAELAKAGRYTRAEAEQLYMLDCRYLSVYETAEVEAVQQVEETLEGYSIRESAIAIVKETWREEKGV